MTLSDRISNLQGTLQMEDIDLTSKTSDATHATAQAQAKPVRMGVLGDAKIARSLIDGIASSELIKVVAVASRDLERSRAFANKFAIEPAYGVHLVEAYPYRAQRQTLEVQRLLAEHAIGRPQTLHASFGFTFSDPHNIRFDPARGGGALLDGGSYAMNFVRVVTAEKPGVKASLPIRFARY